MILQELYLRNFRNFSETAVRFDRKINLICGNNAQGKTNLLEALFLLSTGRSFRTQHLSELIFHGRDFFFLEAKIIQNSISQSVSLSFDGQTKRVEHNSMRFSSFQPLLGLLPSTLFAPQDLDLIVGSPASRRRFFNLHLAQSDPLYVHHLLRFHRALKQRNALLRHASQDGIEAFEQEMAHSAAYLFEKRSSFLHELSGHLQDSCQKLSSEAIQLRYIPSQSVQESYLAQLKKCRIRERQLGITLHGPHRDDFLILLEEKPARLFASEGQKRTALAALRLAEWSRLAKQVDLNPLFGIDDFEMHLDGRRQKLFRDALNDLGQVFITTPQMDWEEGHRIGVLEGSVSYTNPFS